MTSRLASVDGIVQELYDKNHIQESAIATLDLVDTGETKFRNILKRVLDSLVDEIGYGALSEHKAEFINFFDNYTVAGDEDEVGQYTSQPVKSSALDIDYPAHGTTGDKIKSFISDLETMLKLNQISYDETSLFSVIITGEYGHMYINPSVSGFNDLHVSIEVR